MFHLGCVVGGELTSQDANFPRAWIAFALATIFEFW